MAKMKLDAEKIYKILKRKIILLEYIPGAVLNEADLAEEYNISRTPIRRVFQLLENDKLLNIIPRLISIPSKCTILKDITNDIIE